MVRVDVTTRMNGDLIFEPVTDNQGELGNATKRFRLVRAVTVTSGDHVFDDGESVYRVFEGPRGQGLRIRDETPGSRTHGQVSRMLRMPTNAGILQRAVVRALGIR